MLVYMLSLLSTLISSVFTPHFYPQCYVIQLKLEKYESTNLNKYSNMNEIVSKKFSGPSKLLTVPDVPPLIKFAENVFPPFSTKEN